MGYFRIILIPLFFLTLIHCINAQPNVRGIVWQGERYILVNPDYFTELTIKSDRADTLQKRLSLLRHEVTQQRSRGINAYKAIEKELAVYKKESIKLDMDYQHLKSEYEKVKKIAVRSNKALELCRNRNKWIHKAIGGAGILIGIFIGNSVAR